MVRSYSLVGFWGISGRFDAPGALGDLSTSRLRRSLGACAGLDPGASDGFRSLRPGRAPGDQHLGELPSDCVGVGLIWLASATSADVRVSPG